ncbi:MAG: hypothetical protein ACO3YZ_05225 [Candidatus Nanopelagicaceae bacterium]
MIKINALGNKILATDEGLEIKEPSYRTNRDRALIQSAFNSGDYDLVPEIDQPPISPPRWTEFNVAMLSNQNWQQWKTGIPDDLRIALITSSVVGKDDAFQSAYDLACSLSPPSSAAIEEWRTIATQYSIPVNL